MNALDRLIGYVAPTTAVRRVESRARLAASQRFYDAARPGRGTAGWRRPFTSARSETYAGLPWLRASAHDVVRNNPHAAKIVSSLAHDLIGTGIMPRADTGRKALNKKVDALAAEFFRDMDADGITKNYPGYQVLAARALFEGGEAVSRRFIRPRRLGLKVPLQFALLEGEYIDNQKNVSLPTGNRIIQGVEFNLKDRTRDAYWMFTEHPGDTYMAAVEGSYETVRIPAADVQIMMEPQRPGQVRGVPWITPILMRAKMLDDYEDAERQRKRTESSINAIVKSSDQAADASDPTITSLFPTMTDCDGRPIEVVTPGSIVYARNATDIEFPKVADAMGYAPYKRSELQSLAAGARSTYELTSGDLSQTSFSSIQFGTLSYRGMMDVVRATIVIPHLEWIWRSMIDAAVLAGLLPEGTPYGVKHHCPPWLPIDPEKQANADKTTLRTGVKSLYEVVTASGKDFEEHVAEIAASNKLLDKYGLILDSDARRTDLRGVEQQVAAETEGNVPNPPEDNPDQA